MDWRQECRASGCEPEHEVNGGLGGIFSGAKTVDEYCQSCEDARRCVTCVQYPECGDAERVACGDYHPDGLG